jgi:hypothetical protein
MLRFGRPAALTNDCACLNLMDYDKEYCAKLSLWNGVSTAETERLNKVLHKTGYPGA